MRCASLIMIALVMAPLAARAQQTDSQQILQLLQGMNGRLDTIEKRLDSVEKAQPAPAAGPAPVKAPATAAPAAVAVPGWKIDVFPYTKDGVASAPIARSRAPVGKTFLNLHFDGGPVSSFVVYEGKAYFWAKVPGTYTFNLFIDQSNAQARIICSGSLGIEETEVIPKFDVDYPAGQSGSVELQEGKYLLHSTVGCWLSGNSMTYAMELNLQERYKSIYYTIGVLGPDDTKIRDFDRDELFVVAAPSRPKEKPSAP